MFGKSKVYLGFSLLVMIALFLPMALSVAPVIAGQPNQSCQVTTVTPGRAASAPGSAFNPTGTSGMVYAGQQPQNSNNPNSVAQYDVACYQNTIH